MNGNGDLYATKSLRDALDEKLREAVQPMPVEGLAAPDGMEVSEGALKMLAGMNRRARRAFYAERKRGVEEGEALSVAQDTAR